MKKSFLYIVLIFLAAGIASSCKKWMDLKPQDGIVAGEFWNTKEQVDAAVIGIYTSMQASTELFFIWGEARTDMVGPGFRAIQDEQDIVNLNMLANNRYVNWRTFYQSINYCNNVIQLAPEVLLKDNTFTQAHLDRAVGEALALRGLLYFYLVRSFGEVPLKLNATLSDEDIINIPKSKSDVILAQILADLKKAEAAVPLTYGSNAADKGRVTRYGVNAILADVYLWMDKYAEAAAECDKIINSHRFSLVNGQNFFNEVFLEGNSDESIFELQFDVQRLNPFYGMHTPANKRWGAAVHLADAIYGIDLVNPVPLVDVRGDKASFRSTDFTIWKYVGADNAGNTFRAQDQSFANWIFYRYADILLLKAEALNEQNKPLEASRIVKDIRTRASAIELRPMDSTSKTPMASFILEERQRELAFEGKRWYDVLRNAKRNNYERRQLLLSMAAISLPPERRQAAFNKLQDNNSHYFPIYFYELQTNKLLEQNPFYK
ncbi:MAG: RagB/SusD family nutrient uptake outer membrane protein [Chitinophagaceae bacterium]